MAGRCPPIKPYNSGMLDAGDGHQVYWERCGNPDGTPSLFFHGGPGSGCSPGQRRFLDPGMYGVTLFDQRGSGRSRPLASDPDAGLSANTTAHLTADIEALRRLHGVQRWTILGMSWGTTLAAVRQLRPSTRGYHWVLKLSRTIADLAGSDHIETSHLAEVLQHRPRE